MIERKRVIIGRTRWKGRELYLDMIERKRVIPGHDRKKRAIPGHARKEESYTWT
jgi:hypothetical protein